MCGRKSDDEKEILSVLVLVLVLLLRASGGAEACQLKPASSVICPQPQILAS